MLSTHEENPMNAIPQPRNRTLTRHQINGLMLFGSLVFVTLMLAATAHAGTGGDEFNDLYTKLTGWMGGYLGRVVSAVFIIVGLIAGVTKGSVMGFATGIAAGLGMFMAPNLIDATVSATLPILPIIGG